MAVLILLIFGVLWSAPGFCQENEALPLIEYLEEKRLSVNEEALSILKDLSSPLRIIAAIGDARVGKSTTLNKLIHTWKGRFTATKQMFRTSDGYKSCTKGIWMYIIENEDSSNSASTILLDVEGIGIGDDEQIEKLSIITGLLASEMMLFSSNILSNYGLDFIYRMCRSKEINLRDKSFNAFGTLHGVIIGHLSPGSEEDYVKSFLTEETGDQKMDTKRALIRQHFHPEYIKGTQIPSIESDLFNEPNKLDRNAAYKKAIQELAAHLEKSPLKHTLAGSQIDGQMIADLVKTIVSQSTEKWYPNYNAYEEELCDRESSKLLETIKNNSSLTSTELKSIQSSTLSLFRKKCNLDKEHRHFEDRWRDILETKEKEEEKYLAEQNRIKEENKNLTDELEVERESKKHLKNQLNRSSTSEEHHHSNKITLWLFLISLLLILILCVCTAGVLIRLPQAVLIGVFELLVNVVVSLYSICVNPCCAISAIAVSFFCWCYFSDPWYEPFVFMYNFYKNISDN